VTVPVVVTALMGLGFSSQHGFSHSKLVEVSVLKGSTTLRDKYEVEKKIGAGTQGKTFLVRNKRAPHGRYVVKETHEQNPDAFADLLREFDHLKGLQHPNITKVNELVQGKALEDGVWKDYLYVVSEYAVGHDLLHYMQDMILHKASSSITEDWVAQVFRQGLLGVSYLHGKLIVHNDLKPENLLCMQAFDPQNPGKVPFITITDFGCAKAKGERDFCSGDPRYQSPESFRALIAVMKGEATLALTSKVSFPTDVWSMGVIFFELLSGGVIPFLYEVLRLKDITHDPDNWEKLKRGVLEEELQLMPHLEGVSDAALELLVKAMHKDQEARPTASEMLQDEWFQLTAASGRRISKSSLSRLEFKQSKGMAHMILLNALATKLQREHYADSWKVFQKVDADSNGRISLEEFRDAYGQLSLSRCQTCVRTSRLYNSSDSRGAEAEDLFSVADVDNDGSLNFPEFMAVTFDWSSLDDAALTHTLRQLFNQLDKNHDQQVSFDELAEIFHGALSKEEVKNAFSRIDLAGSNYVTLEELETFLFQAVSAQEIEKYCAEDALHQCRAPRLLKSPRPRTTSRYRYFGMNGSLQEDTHATMATQACLVCGVGACLIGMCHML